MAIPNFRKVPGKVELQKIDWTNSKATVEGLKALDNDLKFNTKARGDFLASCRKEAEDLVKGLEDVAVAMKSLSKRNAVKLPDVGKLKEQRTAVKDLMNQGKACEVAFFDAMGDFRQSGNFELPEKIEAVISKLRGATQTADKQYADLPGALIALEARASAALKSVNAGMGVYDDDAKTVEKMGDMLAKLTEMQKKANTATGRIESSVGFVTKNMQSKDKKILGLCEIKSAEIAKEAGSAVQFQVAVKAGTVSIKSMHDSIADPGMKTNQGRPLFDEANQRLVDVLNNMEKAEKVLLGLLKDKNLPKNLKAALPAGVK